MLHYVAMLVLALLGAGMVRLALPGASPLVTLPAVLVIVFLYPFAVRRVGYAPESWE
ncbi:MAG: hypothetical protein V5A43_02920 [Haloarculaceae archaeon]